MFRGSIVLLIALPLGFITANPTPAQNAPSPAEKKAVEQVVILTERCFQLEATIRKLELAFLRQEKPKAAAAQPETDIRVSIVTLKRANAATMAKTLQELFHTKNNAALGIAADPTTNSVLIRGNDQQTRELAVLIDRLEALTAQQRVLPKEKVK